MTDLIKDKTQLGYVITREGEDGTVIPLAIFSSERFQDACDTAEAYTQKFKDDGIPEYWFKVHTTAFYD